MHSVVAGSLFSSCVISHSSDECLDSAIYELASNERFFQTTLDRISQVFMKPILSQNTGNEAGFVVPFDFSLVYTISEVRLNCLVAS